MSKPKRQVKVKENFKVLRATNGDCWLNVSSLIGSTGLALFGMLASRGNPGGVHERYLTSELQGRRYDIGLKYGLLTAQLALALDGNNRDEVLSGLVELLANRAR